MKKFLSILLLFSLVLSIMSCSDKVDPIQKQAEEYIVHLVETRGYHAPTSAKVLKAGYESSDITDSKAAIFGADVIFYFTIQATTKGGGATSDDVVILCGGSRDKEIMSNDDPGNDESFPNGTNLDVAGINTALTNHWKSLGIE